MATKVLSLDACVKQVPASQGIHVSSLQPLQKLQIRTRNHPYAIYVLEPFEGRVLVHGGRFFPEYREAQLCGSSWGGSILRVGWIGVGMCLEVLSGGMRIVTTPIQSLDIRETSTSSVS